MMAEDNIYLKKIINEFRAKKGTAPKTSCEKLNSYLNLINALAYNHGLEMVEGWRPNKRIIFPAILLSFAVCVVFYSFYLEYKTLICIQLVGGTLYLIPIIIKFLCIFLEHPKYQSLLRFSFNVIEQNGSGKREAILSKVTYELFLHSKLILMSVVFGLLFYCIYPCYDFLFNGNYTLISPLYVPYVDPTILSGYLALTLMNCLLAMNGIIGGMAFVFLFLLFVDVYGGLVLLMEDDLREFDNLWENFDEALCYKRKHAFRNILQELMDLARFNIYMNEIYTLIASVELVGHSIGIVALLFAFLVDNYIGGIGASFYFYFEMSMFCLIGTLMDTSSKKILRVIKDTKWYNYDVKYQKDIMIAIALLQNLISIRVVKIYPLNVETLLLLTKNIYSTLMVMLNFLN